VSKAKLIQVTHMATKHANVNFLTFLWSIFLHTTLGVEGWFGTGWVVGFDGFECFFLLVIIGAWNKLGSTLLTFILTSLKTDTQIVCGFSCTLLNSTQVILSHFLTHHGSLKMRRQVSNLLFQLGVLFGSMQKLTLERHTNFTWR
jgi:hypothetical protein